MMDNFRCTGNNLYYGLLVSFLTLISNNALRPSLKLEFCRCIATTLTSHFRTPAVKACQLWVSVTMIQLTYMIAYIALYQEPCKLYIYSRR
jgi:hypothetical protein